MCKPVDISLFFSDRTKRSSWLDSCCHISTLRSIDSELGNSLQKKGRERKCSWEGCLVTILLRVQMEIWDHLIKIWWSNDDERQKFSESSTFSFLFKKSALTKQYALRSDQPFLCYFLFFSQESIFLRLKTANWDLHFQLISLLDK